MADFPNGWTNDTDTLHVDFKIPSEHTIGGQRFDAEMQIFNLHVDRRRTPVQGVLIKATKDGFNYYFEEALKAFERKYSYDLQMCQNKRRRRKLDSGEATMRRRLGLVDERQDHGGASDASSSSLFTPEEAETYDNVRDELEEKEGEATDGGRRDRDLQIGVWDPFHSMLIPSIYFWRYDGSLTEPPCGEFVSWFICDVPMTISISQLERMKKVLFNHVDQDCRPTSSQFDHGVARPIQDRGGRPVWRCKPSDFGPDPPGGFV
jgi:carbonic anhydrase